MKSVLTLMIAVATLSISAFANDYKEGVAAGVEGVSATAFAGGAIASSAASREFNRVNETYEQQKAMAKGNFEIKYEARQNALKRQLEELKGADMSTAEKRAEANIKRNTLLHKLEQLELTKQHLPEWKYYQERLIELSSDNHVNRRAVGRLMDSRQAVMVGGAAGMVAGGVIYLNSGDEKIEQPKAAPAEETANPENARSELGD